MYWALYKMTQKKIILDIGRTYMYIPDCPSLILWISSLHTSSSLQGNTLSTSQVGQWLRYATRSLWGKSTTQMLSWVSFHSRHTSRHSRSSFFTFPTTPNFLRYGLNKFPLYLINFNEMFKILVWIDGFMSK